MTEDLEAAGIAGYGARQANCGWFLGVFTFITLLKADPLRPKDPYAGNFGYRHDNFEHPRGRRLARLPAAHRALAAKDRTPLLFITNWLPRGEANGKDRFGSRCMRHQQVIENFLNGRGGLGTYVKATEDVLSSKFPSGYSPYGQRDWQHIAGQQAPLAVRLAAGDLLVNGAALPWPMRDHQSHVLREIPETKQRFGVVPFHAITAAWTDGEVREWEHAPFSIKDLQKEVGVVVPSAGERWREVTEADEHGNQKTRNVHTLGDSVVRVRDRLYISAVDETGPWGRGMYFLAELVCDREPQSIEEALDFLKPKVVREAEARGTHVRRQGEWFAIPTMRRTSELMEDVSRGIANYRQLHVLGRDGHHQLEEAVIYRAGDRKGEVYARGVLKHTGQEHQDLNLGAIRWHFIVHNVTGAAYTLQGGAQAQFD